MFMAAAHTPADQPKPSRAGRLLGLVRRLIDYGKELAASLHQRAATDPRAVVRSFGVCDLALIVLRIKRGLLRANALEARLVQNAARLDAGRTPRSAPTEHNPRPARPAVPRTEDPNAPLALPTEAAPPGSAAGRSASSSPISAATSAFRAVIRYGGNCKTPSSARRRLRPAGARDHRSGSGSSAIPCPPTH
jgi:hypothetical protein